MRFILLVVVVVFSSGLMAGVSWNRVLFAPTLDLDVEFRSGRKVNGGWIHSIGTQASYRQTLVFDDSFSLGLGARSGFEQWFGLNPAPRRMYSGFVFDLGIDGEFDEPHWVWTDNYKGLEAIRSRSFPFARSTLLTMHLLGGLDFVRIDAFGPHVSGPGDNTPETGVRPWAGAYVGMFFITLEGGYAGTLPFNRGDMDSEVWAHVGIGRPRWTFSGHVGYRYQSTGRFAAHYLSVGFQAAF